MANLYMANWSGQVLKSLGEHIEMGKNKTKNIESNWVPPPLLTHKAGLFEAPDSKQAHNWLGRGEKLWLINQVEIYS